MSVSKAAESRNKLLVLNVDDDAAGRYAVGRSLKLAGYDVVDAESGAEALVLVTKLHPDVLLLDVRLPDLDGFEVCRRVRSNPEAAETPVIHMSASYVDARSKVKALELGADAYLTEPVDPEVLIATIRSVLRIKQSEQKVRQTALQWQSTFDSIGDGVALVDSEGSVLRRNLAFQRLVEGGWPPTLTESITEGARALRNGAGRQVYEIAAGEKALSVAMDPVLIDGSFEGSVCVVSDNTEQKRFEAEMRQTARLESIGVLAGGIAHDFNNLLTGIIGNASLLQDAIPIGTGERELLEDLLKASVSAADLTKQLLAYSGKGQSLKLPVNLTEVALESRAFVRRLIPPGIELIVDTDPGLPPVHADSSQMMQLVMNLVINAAEASEGNGAGGTVTLKTAVERLGGDFFRPSETGRPGEFIVLTVIDNGCGMTEETQKHIFDPFFTTKFTGRGLGLSAVHGIIKSHEGMLRLDSRLGHGSTFRVFFPVWSGKYLARAKGGAAVQGQGTILFVDDEPLVRNFAKAALEKQGFRVLLAENGALAVEILETKRAEVSLIILDYAMPVMNGEQAFAHLRRLAPTVPILLSSGFNEAEASERFTGKGLSGFLAKPYTASQMAEAVDAALHHRDQVETAEGAARAGL